MGGPGGTAHGLVMDQLIQLIFWAGCVCVALVGLLVVVVVVAYLMTFGLTLSPQ